MYLTNGFYENANVVYVQGQTPTAFFYSDSGREVGKLELGNWDMETIKSAFKEDFNFEFVRPKLKTIEKNFVSEISFGGVHYQYFGDGKLYFEDAFKFADNKVRNGRRGRLLTFHCKSQEDKIIEWINNTEVSYWLGASDVELINYWKWFSTGKLFFGPSVIEGVYSNWKQYEPNNANNAKFHDIQEDCAIGSAGGWNDVQCTSGASLIVEYGNKFTEECENEEKIRKEKIGKKEL